MQGGAGVAQGFVPGAQGGLQLADALAGFDAENLGLFAVAQVAEAQFDVALADLDAGEDFADLDRLAAARNKVAKRL